MRVAKISIVSVICIILLFGCAPLKRIQRDSKTKVHTVDRSAENLIRSEVQRQIGELSQVVVEFYPPSFKWTYQR